MSRISQRYNDSDTACDVTHGSHEIGKKCHFVLMRLDGAAVVIAPTGKPFKTRKDALDYQVFNNVGGYEVEHRMNQFQENVDR